ncbi:MAG: Dyp-type peroxidase, partial [Solirubrobacteraceae bacterium]
MAAAPLDLADLQGDIVRAYGNAYAHTAYLFFHIDDADAGRAWLRRLLARVTTAEPWTEGKPEATLNIAVTAAGVKALGVPDAVIATFSREFRSGMAARAATLGDAGPSNPERWEPELHDGALHVLATVNALDADALRRELGRLRDDAAATGGVAVAYEQATELLPGSREHFGYADGFAQPSLAGVEDAIDRRVGGGVPEKDGAWRPLAPGEFILGYEDEDTRVDPNHGLPSAPADPYGRSGTYMVWRKLHQDVALFRQVLREAAELYGAGDHEKLAAKVVGRWPNGTPLVVSPDAPIADFEPKTDARANAFRYADEDPRGLRCPLGAHIRRSNPRDALGFDGLLSFRHRIIRRGMPYGPPLASEAGADDHVDRGLIFVCFNASISRQFEGIQAQWLNDGNVFHLAHDSDFLLGDPHGTGKMTVEGDPPFFLGPQGPFVTTRGGAYLFVP